MNRLRFHQYLWVLLLPLLWFTGTVTHGATPSTAARFLIVVDTSSGMRKLDNVSATVVYDLVYDGILGRMDNGDSLAVWTFNETVDTEFYPPTEWNRNYSRSLAQSIDAQLRKAKYGGRANLDGAIRAINSVITKSDDLTVIIVHDGSGVMFGTPFDLPITTLYRQFHKDMLKNDRPFLTSFLVKDKKMIGWSVDAAGGTIGIPILPRKPVTPPAPTNTVAKATTPKPAEPEKQLEPKKTPPAPIIVKGPLKPATNSVPAQAATKPTPKPTEKPAAEMNTKSAPVSVETKPVTKPEVTSTVPATSKPFQPVFDNGASKATPPPSAAQNSSTPIPSPAPKPNLGEPTMQLAQSTTKEPVQAADIVPVKTPEPTAPTIEVKPVLLPEQVPPPPVKPAPTNAITPSPAKTAVPPAAANAAQKTVDAAANLAQTAVVTPVQTGPDWMKLSLGVLCLGGAIGISLYFTRKNRQVAHGSVISRSMDHGKK